jgi:eukaryotic-like serine/threonine-protein kinase
MALSSVPNDSEEGRAFLQQRLALFGKSAFFIFAGVSVFGLLVILASSIKPWELIDVPPFHAIPILGVGLAWLYCRRGRRSLRSLALLDAAITIMVGLGLALLVIIMPAALLPGVQATFILTQLLIVRAILVPSDWRRTLHISATAALAPALVILVIGVPVATIARLWAYFLPAWCAIAVVVASWTSHVIYRLRRRVVEARRLGQYTLEDQIGEGGMGIVFRARHALLRRPTVVKLLPLEKAGEANLARFEREVQLTSQLSSPNTVAIYDFGRTLDGVFYYAMEYLDGLDLEQLVEQSGAQPIPRVLHILAQVCAALAEAHDAGLVHRDIKPGNVMLCRHGGGLDVVKVLDFGLVKSLGGNEVKLTHADSMVGTPLYLSPEAISDPSRVDARSDLYAVGGLGYFLATGRTVFQGKSIPELCAKHLYEEPTPPSRWTAVPADLETILLTCLAKTPARRPADARALRAELLRCADAGRWTDDDARTWWAARKAAPPAALAATLPGA